MFPTPSITRPMPQVRLRRDTALRVAGLLYAASAFAGTFAFFTTFIVFLGNLPKASSPWLVPSADVGSGMAWPLAVAWNALLITIFCLQHSLVARAGVKRAIAAVMPEPLERATYVHAANIAGILVILLWQPVPVVLWDIDNDILKTVLWIAFGIGWLLLFVAALSIDLLELLGIRQAWAWFSRRQPAPLVLKTNWLYRYIEHPMYVGVVLGFWMTPLMTVGHAALAAQLTLYIAIAMSFERRDLRGRFGAPYDLWRESQVPTPPLPEFARAIAWELGRRYRPLANEPLTQEMRSLLARLPSNASKADASVGIAVARGQ
jgi:protein-S-isoprenylcysteine O-methyltransferase Ste14